MKEIIGPRELFCISPDGREGTIKLTLMPADDRIVSLGGGDTEPRAQVTILIESDWFSKSITLPGEDHIQAIYRVMWISSIYVSKICADNGYKLFSLTPGDVKEEMDIFR